MMRPKLLRFLLRKIKKRLRAREYLKIRDQRRLIENREDMRVRLE
jgi:hypothetical protein